MRRCRPSDHTSGEAMNPPLPSNHRPAPPRAVGRRLIALVASIALAMTGLISMALAPAASAGVAPNLANCPEGFTQIVFGRCASGADESTPAVDTTPPSATFQCPQDQSRPWSPAGTQLVPFTCTRTIVTFGPDACAPHSELVDGKCRDGNEVDCLDEGGVWNQGELKCYTTDDCVPPSHLMEEDGCSVPTEQEICEFNGGTWVIDPSPEPTSSERIVYKFREPKGSCTLPPPPPVVETPTSGGGPAPTVDYCPAVDGVQWEGFDCLTGIQPAADTAPAAVVDAAVAVAVPAAATVSAEIPAAAVVSVPQAATLPSAVPAGGGSSAPNGGALWALAIVVAAALGAAGVGRRLAGTHAE